MKNHKENNSFWEGLKERGYYGALLICALAIAMGGFIYYRLSHTELRQTLDASSAAPAVTKPQTTRPASNVPEQLVPAIGTVPPSEEEEPGETTVPQAETKPASITRPVDGETAAAYSMDQLAYNETTRDWRVHNGIDLTAEAGAQVLAAADGEVYTVYTDEIMGTTVVLRHAGGYTTTYASLSPEPVVSVGDRVKSGDPIGYVGTSALTETALAPHVHFAVALNGTGMDPEEFLN